MMEEFIMLKAMEQHQKLSFLLDGVPFEQHRPKVTMTVALFLRVFSY